MYLCVCKAVSDTRLRRAMEAGEVTSLRDLCRATGLGSGCGKCIPAARAAVEQTRAHCMPAPVQASFEAAMAV